MQSNLQFDLDAVKPSQKARFLAIFTAAASSQLPDILPMHSSPRSQSQTDTARKPLQVDG
jgi:hypothetical protein